MDATRADPTDSACLEKEEGGREAVENVCDELEVELRQASWY